jgi:hypothetical protein
MPAGPALLVVGHPGHELRVHGWLSDARPLTLVLTDGSGHGGTPRLSSTTDLLGRAGAAIGPVFGKFSDALMYQTLLKRHTSVLVDLAVEISEVIIRNRITVVAGDDAEGYNPTHDVCRMLIDAAIELAQASSDASIANLAFALMDHPDKARATGGSRSSQIVLGDESLARKISAALDYAELAGEVRHARQTWGDEAFRMETFRHVAPGELWTPMGEAPFYENYGSERVKAGAYAEVIRYDQHIRPLADALAARALRRAS